MKIFCDYHPTKPALWNCPECNANFCAGCVTKRVVEQYGKKKSYHFCPKCNVKTDRLGIGNIVTPFWNRLPKFFAYPFHPRPLLLMIVLSIATIFFSKPTLYSLLMRIAILGVLLKYSFAALKSTANGNLTPPKINMQTISEDFQVVFKQFGIFIIIGIGFAKIAQTAGVFIGFLFLGLAILSIPAMIIVLVATDSLLQAINPMVFARMAWRIGWGYLLLYLFCTLLGGAPAVLGKFIIAFLPASLHLFLFTMAKTYYTIISYHLMGYVVFQYHEEIGYNVDLDDEDFTSQYIDSEQDTDNEMLNRVNMLVKEGKIDDAISLIQDETKGDISDINLAEQYYNLLKIRQLIPEILKHGRPYLDLFVKTNRKDKACEMYSYCISKNPEFTPNPSTLFKIAGYLNEAGDPKGAIQAYNRFTKTDSKSPLTPKAYFLAANIINEKLKNPRKAAGILKGIIKAYPNHGIIPYAQRYLSQINIPNP